MNNAAVIARCEDNRIDPIDNPERDLITDWYTFPTYNADYEYSDDNLEIQIRLYEREGHFHGEPLRYCYDLEDGRGAVEYDAQSFDPVFSWAYIERQTRRFVKDHVYTMLEQKAA